MEPSMFALAPFHNRAKSLREELDRQLSASYSSLLETVEVGLSIESRSLAVLAPASSPEYPLSSRAYASHWQLAFAIKSGLLDLVKSSLRELSEGWHETYGLNVATYHGDLIDRAAERYLSGKEGRRIRRPHRSDDGSRPADLCRISSSELSELQPIVHQAAKRIAELDSGMADELREYVRQVRLVESDVIGGMSSVRFFGTVFLSRPDRTIRESALAAHFFSGLVHETSHLHLHALMAQDPLVLNRNERFDSPLRRDKRPMLGIYHATFVLARLALMFGRWNHADPTCQAVIGQMRDAQNRLSRGVATIREHGHLTARGSELLDSMALVDSVVA